MSIKERAKQLKTDIPAVFFALKQQETPLLAKLLAVVVVAYALSPIDLIPNFIPVLGLLDDVIILPWLVAIIVKMIPPDVMARCREEAAGLWAEGKPKKWYYALPIIVIWLLEPAVNNAQRRLEGRTPPHEARSGLRGGPGFPPLVVSGSLRTAMGTRRRRFLDWRKIALLASISVIDRWFLITFVTARAIWW